MAKLLTIQDFFRMFPDDDTCLAHLFDIRFGPDYPCERCGEVGQWKRLRKMPAYTCNCGNHIHPMAGTPFLRTRTPLQKWFYAMFLFTTTRNGVAAKELQRQLGVTYKTAWRMAEVLTACHWASTFRASAPTTSRRAHSEFCTTHFVAKERTRWPRPSKSTKSILQ